MYSTNQSSIFAKFSFLFAVVFPFLMFSQSSFVGDVVYDVDDNTLSVLTELSNQSNQSIDYMIYLNEVLHDIQEETGIPTSIFWVIMKKESSNFSSELFMNANNPMGKKADKNWKGRVYNVEHFDYDKRTGKWIQQKTPFRRYNTPADALWDVAEHLQKAPWYQDCFECSISNYKCWLYALAPKYDKKGRVIEPGYFTDPDYIDSCIEKIEDFNLASLVK